MADTFGVAVCRNQAALCDVLDQHGLQAHAMNVDGRSCLIVDSYSGIILARVEGATLEKVCEIVRDAGLVVPSWDTAFAPTAAEPALQR